MDKPKIFTMIYKRNGVTDILKLYFILYCSDKLCHAQTRFYTTRTARQCFSSGDSRMRLEACDPGHMILVHDAFQGISQDAEKCGYERGDCLNDVTAQTEAQLTRCIGARSCELSLEAAWLPQCRGYSDYNVVIYTCVPREDTMNICETNKRQLFRKGFIISHSYPARYAQDLICNCNITTERNQKLLLTFSDFAIEWSENCYKDVLRIRDGNYEMSRCGRLLRNHNITSVSNRLQVALETDGWREHKGFWLQVEALGGIDIECASSKPLYLTTTQAPDATSTELPLYGSKLQNTHQNEDTFIIKDQFSLSEATYKHLLTTQNDDDKDLEQRPSTFDRNSAYFEEYTNMQGNTQGTTNNYGTEVNNIPSEKGTNIDLELDIILAEDIFNNGFYDERNSNRSELKSLKHTSIDDETNTESSTDDPLYNQPKPLLVISPTAGIILGVCLLVVLFIILICIALWCKKHRRKKEITQHRRTSEPRLMRHAFPPINSPRPRMHTPRSRGCIGGASPYKPRPHISSPRPTTSGSGPFPLCGEGTLPIPQSSPRLSVHSFAGSDFSLSSGDGRVRRVDRVKIEKHYHKRARISPRLDTSKLSPQEHHNMDSDDP